MQKLVYSIVQSALMKLMEYMQCIRMSVSLSDAGKAESLCKGGTDNAFMVDTLYATTILMIHN